MSAVRPAVSFEATESGLFDAYRDRDGVVLQHGREGLAAAGESQEIKVIAGPEHVRRAADLVRTALAGSAGQRIAMGALPFAGSCDAVLRVPERVIRGVPAYEEVAPEAVWAVTALIPEPLPVAYEAAVERALEAIEAGEVEKVVLARTLLVETDAPIDPRLLARRLQAEEQSAYVYLVALPGGSHLVGASPELVVRRRGRKVFSDPLAGTARRSRDRMRDQEIARQLLDTVKEQREHRLVAEAVADALAPFCVNLTVDSEAGITSTATLWHLHTAIKGTLKLDAPDALTIAAALHPTPAVCGTPQPTAAALIEHLEPIDRRFFAGLVGWVDAQGDGEWALSLRCAEVSGGNARLHAGAGIVAGSVPASEDLETEAKFGVGLRALGALPAED
ncbi:MAG TPA: isochorismate synthase [Candidatus Dormibacteraeota bacterium]